MSKTLHNSPSFLGCTLGNIHNLRQIKLCLEFQILLNPHHFFCDNRIKNRIFCSIHIVDPFSAHRFVRVKFWILNICFDFSHCACLQKTTINIWYSKFDMSQWAAESQVNDSSSVRLKSHWWKTTCTESERGILSLIHVLKHVSFKLN